MITTKKVNSQYYQFSKNGTTHLINKDLDLSTIRVNKADIVEDEQGLRSRHESKGKSFPLLELTVSPIDSAIKNAKVVIYGDSIPELLGLEMEETDKELIFVAAYSKDGNKWASNRSLLEKAMESTPEPKSADSDPFAGLTVPQAKKLAKEMGVPMSELTPLKTVAEIQETAALYA